MEKHSIFNKVWLILLVVFSLVLICVLTIVLTNRPVAPKISILKIQPCLQENNQQMYVENFKVGDMKYICAEVESDTYPETLSVIVEPLNDLRNAHAYEARLYAQKSNISFLIFDKLSPGAYRARILYARNTLGSVQFNVDQE
jgi:hypothetical protein